MSGSSNLLNWILWMPMLGVLGVLLLPKAKESAIRYWALINTGISLVLSILLYLRFDNTVPGMQVPFDVKNPMD